MQRLEEEDALQAKFWKVHIVLMLSFNLIPFQGGRIEKKCSTKFHISLPHVGKVDDGANHIKLESIQNIEIICQLERWDFEKPTTLRCFVGCGHCQHPDLCITRILAAPCPKHSQACETKIAQTGESMWLGEWIGYAEEMMWLL